MRISCTLALAVVLLGTGPAFAHHTATPPIVRLTSSGDVALPRVPPFGGMMALVLDGGASHPLVSLKLFDHPDVHTTLSSNGTNSNPSVATSRVVAWDSDADPFASGDPGRQIYLATSGLVIQVTHDPSGTSVNPAVNARGNRVVFQSAGNLTGNAVPGSQQIYLRNVDGSFLQVSTGAGTSANATMNRLGGRIVYQSTSDPLDASHDTGIAQVWLVNLGTPPRPVTAGQGASVNPAISGDGRLVVFESTADLAHGGADTGTPQIFAYDVLSGNFAQITDDAVGCTGPSTRKDSGDWRIAFTCGGEGYYYNLRADRRYHVQIPAGDVARMTTGFGFYFLTLSTTANLLGTGTTPGHEVYLVNLYKRPATVVPGVATWFPARGIRAFR